MTVTTEAMSISRAAYAPNLKTVKIRGCWSLRKLPVVGRNKAVSCDCEKEWWDNLEWDSKVQPSDYKPSHSQHYKKTMIRRSSLRCVCHCPSPRLCRHLHTRLMHKVEF